DRLEDRRREPHALLRRPILPQVRRRDEAPLQGVPRIRHQHRRSRRDVRPRHPLPQRLRTLPALPPPPRNQVQVFTRRIPASALRRGPQKTLRRRSRHRRHPRDRRPPPPPPPGSAPRPETPPARPPPPP